MNVHREEIQTVAHISPQPALPYTVLPYHTDQLANVLGLTQLSLGSTVVTPKTKEFWLWKHHANPFGASYGLCAWDQEKATLIGLRILMHWQFTAKDGQLCQAVRAVDTATHPQYQRMGIFSGLTKQAISELGKAGVIFIYNTPNSKSLPGYLKMGWQVVSHWPLYLKPVRPWRMLVRRLRPLRDTAALPFATYFDSAILSWSAFRQQYKTEVPALLTAWEAERLQVGLRTPRTVDYLDWRYGQHPTVHYGVCVQTTANGLLCGFAILRPNVRYGWQEVVLTELCVQPGAVANGVKLLRQVVRQVHCDYLIAHFTEQTLERQMLRRSGFFPVPRQGMVFTVRTLQKGLETLLQPEQWDLTLGDLEIF